MTDGVRVEIKGMAELDRKLAAMGEELGFKAMRGALMAGGRVIKEEAKNIIKAEAMDTGAMHDAVRGAYDKKSSRKNLFAVNVFIKHKLKKYKNNRRNQRLGRAGGSYANWGDLYYWRFVEFGTKKMAARPFLSAAFQRQKEKALSAIINKLRGSVDKFARTGKA